MQATQHLARRQQRRLLQGICCCSCSWNGASWTLSQPRPRDWPSPSSQPSSLIWRGFQSTSKAATAAAAASSSSSSSSSSPSHADAQVESSSSSSLGKKSTAGISSLQRPLSSFFKQSFLRSQDGTNQVQSSHMRSKGKEVENVDLDVSLHHPSSRELALSIPPIATPTDTWRPLPSTTTRRVLSYLTIYKQLAKARLSAWIVLTAMAGYAMCPTDPAAAQLAMDALVQDTFGSAAISSAISTGGDIFATTPSSLSTAASTSTSAATSALNDFRVTTLLATAAGTALCSASANTFNQLVEIPYDSQMPRTAKRPLPSHLITPLHAFTFGSISGVTGVAMLYTLVNPLTASLGLLNIVLYAAVYTPLKRLSVVNTWIGALVGGIPPLMGWAACTNSLDPFSGQAGAWVLALILFAWQFPHFNALSWTIRSEYARGGYRMLSAINPGMNARVSLRWTIAGALAAGVGAPLVGLTSWTVGVATMIPSAALGVCAWRFWRAGSKVSLQRARELGVSKTTPGARATDRDPRDAPARSLFFVSLVHLPALLFMMMAGKIWGDYQARSEIESDVVEVD